jgi:hypothetical protein
MYAFGLGLSTVGRTRFENPNFRPPSAVVRLDLPGTAVAELPGRYPTRRQPRVLAAGIHQFPGTAGDRAAGAGRVAPGHPDRPTPLFAVPMLLFVLFHLLLIVYRYVFASASMSIFVAGDLALLFSMASVSSARLGEDTLRAIVERFIEKVG